jgi:phospholipid-binding lipoprotein MlaA
MSGCSSKDIQTPNTTQQIASENVKQEDSELSEFSGEFETKEVFDPLSGYNRFMTNVNDSIYEYFLKPVAKGYKYVLHEEIRISISNAFDNLYFPMRFVNNILQGKFYNASEEAGRFVVNSTVGVLGLFDPAKNYCNLQAHEEDFGQTLGFYGVGGGFHIVLPLLGPSNLRDAISLYPDSLLSPIDYTERDYWTLTDTTAEYLAVKSLEKINYVSLNMQRYDKMKEDAVDLYPYFRDIYEQYRDNQIKE